MSTSAPTASTDEATCAASGCDESAVPGELYCGVHQDSVGDGALDGSGPDNSMGYGDGTDRSGDPEHEDRLAVYRAEVRAKYTEDEVEALGKKGQAFKNSDGSYSYPIADKEDLDNAIHAVGRSNADHDAVRKYIIKRAKALGESDSIPDNWNSDGSIKEEDSLTLTAEDRKNVPETPDERRAASLSFSDQQGIVYQALCDFLAAGIGSAAIEAVDIWIYDMSEDWVVWESWVPGMTALWRISYSMGDDGDVSFSGQPEQVNVTTSYEAVPDEREEESLEAEEREEEPEPEERVEDKALRARRRFKARHRSAPDPREEVRFRISDLEIRSGDGSNDVILEGTPIVYGTAYDVHDMWGTFRETMDPGVCNDVLNRGSLDCRYLFNHDGMPLARTLSGTLELNNGPDGLRSVAHVDTRQHLANDLVIAVQRGDVSQMSCGFVVAEDDWDDDYMNRTVVRFADLLDVSPVTYPASPTTHVAVAQRMMMGLPLESRARLREAFKIANECRAGKVLSAQNAGLLATALDALHRADDVDITEIVTRLQDIDTAVDEGMAALSGVSGIPNPDGDAGDLEPALVDPGEGVREDEDEDLETRESDLAEAAERRKKRIRAERDRLARRRRPV